MRKLLNTLYVTNELAYLSLDGENIVCKLEGSEKFRIPFDNVEGIVCFGYRGCSPALMGKCAEKLIPINFISPSGRFLAKVSGIPRGNVHSRVSQIDIFRENGLLLAQNCMAAKFSNCISVLRRSRHDNPELRENDKVNKVLENLKRGVRDVYNTASIDEVLGVEGFCAKEYFSVFGLLFTHDQTLFSYRKKRPPLDPVNAVLSFLYTIYTSEFASALETAGLDSYVGYYHALRSGRASLACDLVEEARCHVERTTITLFNLGILNSNDFETQFSGAVMLNENGRKKTVTKWQEKKRTDIVHPHLKQKIQFGLLPYIQANLMAKYVRGEIDEYPCYIQR